MRDEVETAVDSVKGCAPETLPTSVPRRESGNDPPEVEWETGGLCGVSAECPTCPFVASGFPSDIGICNEKD